MYLINTNDKFEKVSTNKIILSKIDDIDIYTYNQGTMIELKVHGQEKLQYKPISNNYLDVLTKLDTLNIFENKKPKL